MAKALLGKKLGMTQILDQERFIPVTILEAGPCVVTAVRTPERDGYGAIQLGYGEVNKRKLTKPMAGQFNKHGLEPKRHLAEVRVEDPGAYEVGQQLTAEVFEAGELASVSAVSKGKGFAGPMKRWGFSGQKASHGAHRIHRAPGSIGASATPSRVFPGKRMAGQMGNARVTTHNLEVVQVDVERGLLAIRGSVPGPRGAVVLVRARKKGRR